MSDTITLPRSVVEQALKLWDAQSIDENYDYGGAFLRWNEHARPEELASQFRAALEQPQVEQEPVAWANINKQGDITHTSNKKTAWAKTPLYTHQQPPRQPLTLERPKPLPSTVWRFVPTTMTDAMAAVDKELRHTVPWIRWEAILAAAPQPPRQPLTDQQIHDCFQHKHRDKATERRMITRAIERAHGIGGEAKTRMCPSTYYECSRGCGDGGCKDFSDAHGIGESRHD